MGHDTHAANPTENDGKSDLRAFGDVLRRTRTAKGMSQEQLAWELRTDQKFISALERGIKEPCFRTIFKLARALDVSVASFMGEVEGTMQTQQGWSTRATTCWDFPKGFLLHREELLFYSNIPAVTFRIGEIYCSTHNVENELATQQKTSKIAEFLKELHVCIWPDKLPHDNSMTDLKTFHGNSYSAITLPLLHSYCVVSLFILGFEDKINLRIQVGLAGD